MARDGGLRRLFSHHLRRGFQWTAVETGYTGSGVPDAEYCCLGVTGWVEFKRTDGWAVGLAADQVSWLEERVRRGGRCFVATRRQHPGGPRRGPAADELWLHWGGDAAVLAAGGLRALPPLWWGGGGPAAWDWGVVREHLTSAARR